MTPENSNDSSTGTTGTIQAPATTTQIDPAAIFTNPTSQKPADPVKVEEAAKVEPAKPDEVVKPPVPVKTPEQLAAPNDTKLNPLTPEEVKLPEGFEADESLMKDFVGVVNESGIPRDVVAKLIDLQTKNLKAVFEKGNELGAATRETWRKEVMDDPQIGGQKWPQTNAAIAKVVDKYGDADFRKMLNETGAGDRLQMVKFLQKVAADVSEAGPVAGSPASAEAKSMAEQMYPSMYQKKGT